LDPSGAPALTPDQRRYLLVQSGLGAAIVNAVLNGFIGWVILVGQTEFSVWTVPGVAVDLVATAFGVAFGTVLAAALGVPRDIKRGKITMPHLSPRFLEFLRRFQPNVLKRSIWLGVMSVLIFTPPVLLLCALAGVQVFERGVFVVVKGGFAAAEAALITPLIVLAALLDDTRTAARTG
jgi:hypothetical protein